MIKTVKTIGRKPKAITPIDVETFSEYTFDNGEDKPKTKYTAHMQYCMGSNTLFVFYSIQTLTDDYKATDDNDDDDTETIDTTKYYSKPIKVYPFICLFKEIENSIATLLNVDKVYCDISAYKFKHDQEEFTETIKKIRRINNNGEVQRIEHKSKVKWTPNKGMMLDEADKVSLYLNGVIKDPCIKRFHIDQVVSSNTIYDFITYTVIPYSKATGELTMYEKQPNGRVVPINTPVWDDQHVKWDVYSYPVDVLRPLITLIPDKYKTSKFFDINITESDLTVYKKVYDKTLRKFVNVKAPFISEEKVSTHTYEMVNHTYNNDKHTSFWDNNIVGSELRDNKIFINGYEINRPNKYISHRTEINYKNPYAKDIKKGIKDLPNGKAIINNFVFGGDMPDKLWEVIYILCYSITDINTVLHFKGETTGICQRIAGTLKYIESLPFDLDVYFRIEPSKSYNKQDLSVIEEVSKSKKMTRVYKDYNGLATDVYAVAEELKEYGLSAEFVENEPEILKFKL